MKPWIIVTGGNIDLEQLKYFISHNDCHILGVDGGCELLLKHSIIPDHIVGDFDTLSEEKLSLYKQKNQSMDILNPMKDLTDTHYAFEYLKDQGVLDIFIFGGVGTRLDHSLGNLMVSFSYDMNITFIDEHNIIYCIKNKKPSNIKTINIKSKPYNREYKYLSLLPITETKIIKTSGLKYNVVDIILNPYDSLAISNEIYASEGSIEIDYGMIFIIISKD